MYRIITIYYGLRVSQYFFSQLAKPKVVRNILLQAYCRPEAVTDELVDLIMAPAADP
ncbi:MAG: alpha/beta hydrolase, partial [Moorea sp. SIO4E2]|nr:alpha/beta hydrolase [Moorena sp. SIO4E2]